MELTEVKTLIDTLASTVNEHHKATDEKIALAVKGLGVGEIQTKMTKVFDDITKLQEQKKEMERLNAAIDRLARNVGGTKGDTPEDEVEVKAAYSKFLRKGDGSQGNKQEFSWEKKSMAVVSDSDGGYTVTADMSGRVVERIWETSPMRPLCEVQSISSDALEGLIDQDEAAGGWVGETGARSGSANPKWGKYRNPVFELYAMPAASQKMLDDSSVDVEAWLAKKVADKLARIENTAFVSGDGNNQPRGFLTYPHSATINTEQGYVEQVDGAVATYYMDFGSMKRLVAKLKKQYRMKATFVCNRATVGYLSTLKDNYGRYLWEPSLQLGQPDRIMGYPYEEFADMPDIGSGALCLAFADWQEAYQIVDRIGIRVLRDPYTSKPYVLFYTTKRTGGQVRNQEAIKILKGTAS